MASQNSSKHVNQYKYSLQQNWSISEQESLANAKLHVWRRTANKI